MLAALLEQLDQSSHRLAEIRRHGHANLVRGGRASAQRNERRKKAGKNNSVIIGSFEAGDSAELVNIARRLAGGALWGETGAVQAASRLGGDSGS